MLSVVQVLLHLVHIYLFFGLDKTFDFQVLALFKSLKKNPISIILHNFPIWRHSVCTNCRDIFLCCMYVGLILFFFCLN